MLSVIVVGMVVDGGEVVGMVWFVVLLVLVFVRNSVGMVGLGWIWCWFDGLF